MKKKHKIETHLVQIFTEEYKVQVVIGEPESLIAYGAKYTTYSPKTVEKDMRGNRGFSYNMFPDKNPLILVDSNLKMWTGVAY